MTIANHPQKSSTKIAGNTPTWHVFVLALVAALTLFSRFFHPTFYGFFEDDFFYYALVARHLVQDHLSSFNGLQLTNGYHPLWLATVTLCYAAFSGLTFFVAIEAIAFLAILFYYFGVLRCLTFLKVPQALTRLAALVLSLHALLLFRFGMEVTLALPLGVWTLAYVLSPRFRWAPRQTLLYGLLACLTVLSRLDSTFLFILLIAAQTLTAKAPWRIRWQRVALFSAGWLPFLAYLAADLYFFKTLLPISGAAKQLKPLWPPTAVPLHSLFLPVDRTKAAFVYPAVFFAVLGIASFLRRRPASPPTAQRDAILSALFLFPAVHLGVLCFLSDWNVWPWYFYSLAYATLAATAALFSSSRPTPRLAVPVFVTAVLAFAAYLVTYAVAKQPPYKILSFVSTFSNQHPGIYAMGDGSGTPAFLSTQPFLQLEGLMMDRDYLQLVRRQTPLQAVLQRYHVKYYVVFVPPRTGPCVAVYEPSQGGALSPKLPGKICVPPLATATEGPTQVDIYRAADVQLP